MNKDQFAYLNETIIALEAERDRLKEELENVNKACSAIEKERTAYLHQCDHWRTLAEKAKEGLGYYATACSDQGKLAKRIIALFSEPTERRGER